jgi:high-affinity K+ transport system ATPase subunit B
MVVAMEGDEVQQIGGTGLEAWSDGRERGLLLDLDVIHGVAQRFELVQKLSITRSRIRGWGNDWQGRNSIRSKA